MINKDKLKELYKMKIIKGGEMQRIIRQNDIERYNELMSLEIVDEQLVSVADLLSRGYTISTLQVRRRVDGDFVEEGTIEVVHKGYFRDGSPRDAYYPAKARDFGKVNTGTEKVDTSTLSVELDIRYVGEGGSMYGVERVDNM